MNRSIPGLPVHHKLPEFTQTHAHWVGDAIQSSHPLWSPSPPAPNPSKHQGLFQWVKQQKPSKILLMEGSHVEVSEFNSKDLELNRQYHANMLTPWFRWCSSQESAGMLSSIKGNFSGLSEIGNDSTFILYRQTQGQGKLEASPWGVWLGGRRVAVWNQAARECGWRCEPSHSREPRVAGGWS